MKAQCRVGKVAESDSEITPRWRRKKITMNRERERDDQTDNERRKTNGENVSTVTQYY